MRSSTPPGQITDFDFLLGSWNVQNRRLKKRWTETPQWDEFPSTNHFQKLLGGMVNVDENHYPTRGFSGLSFRIFDAERKRWAIYWVSTLRGDLFPPVFGGFDGNRGLFQGEDVDEGKPIQVRFRWTVFGPDSARWEQEFSLDGEVWEENWVADFTRQK